MRGRSGIDVDVKFDRIDEINAQIPGVVAALVKKATLDTEALAKVRVPVRTGALKNSLTSDIEESPNVVVGEVGTSIFYAAYVEYGTVSQAANPYLVPAFDSVRGQLRRQLAALEKHLEGLGG
jgi:HK97 gp10 family phage protein